MVENKPSDLLELACAIYDLEVVFVLMIFSGAGVSDLREAIFYRLHCDKKYTFAEKELRLRLARKHGKWLTHKKMNTLREFLRGPVDKEYKKMKPSLRLDEVFAPDFERGGSGEIQALVKLPRNYRKRINIVISSYERVSVGRSCREFLNAVVKKLAAMYKFEYKFAPTMKDLLRALDTGKWQSRLQYGQPMTSVPLSEWFSAAELELLQELHIHSACYWHILDGFIPITSRGTFFIGLPHSLYGKDRVSTLKQIAVKARIVSDPADFDVQDGEKFRGKTRRNRGDSALLMRERDVQMAPSFTDVSARLRPFNAVGRDDETAATTDL